MGGPYHARIDEWVKTLNRKLRAAKAEVVQTLADLALGCGRKEESRPEHLVNAYFRSSDNVLRRGKDDGEAGNGWRTRDQDTFPKLIHLVGRRYDDTYR